MEKIHTGLRYPKNVCFEFENKVTALDSSASCRVVCFRMCCHQHWQRSQGTWQTCTLTGRTTIVLRRHPSSCGGSVLWLECCTATSVSASQTLSTIANRSQHQTLHAPLSGSQYASLEVSASQYQSHRTAISIPTRNENNGVELVVVPNLKKSCPETYSLYYAFFVTDMRKSTHRLNVNRFQELFTSSCYNVARSHGAFFTIYIW